MPLLSQKLELLGLQDDTHHIHADPSNIGQGIQEDDDQDSDDEEDDIVSRGTLHIPSSSTEAHTPLLCSALVPGVHRYLGPLLCAFMPLRRLCLYALVQFNASGTDSLICSIGPVCFLSRFAMR